MTNILKCITSIPDDPGRIRVSARGLSDKYQLKQGCTLSSLSPAHAPAVAVVPYVQASGGAAQPGGGQAVPDVLG